MQTEEFLKKVKQRAGLIDNNSAKRASEAVFETLRARISHEGGDNVAAQLPKELKDLWESNVFEHVQRKVMGGERFDLGGFLASVAQKLGLDDISQAETVTKAVFMSMHEQITQGAAQSISHQLPQDIRIFWESSVAQQTFPYEWEAPVETMEQETIVLAETEEEIKAGQETSPSVHPPAMDRVTMASEHAGVQGPASVEHYRSDSQLAEEIGEMLAESDELDPEHIEVFVERGNVTLRGSVKTSQEREVAIEIASEALGVGEIRSELEVISEKAAGGR
ncbi:DUF2267 domain-containing protein [bacterium]|nr:DUF2267 domain-containing protein [bacterium]